MELEKLIRLSKLTFNETELKTLETDMETLVNSLDIITNVSSSKIPTRPFGELREDVLEPSASVAEILKNAPSAERGFFVIDKKGMWK